MRPRLSWFRRRTGTRSPFALYEPTTALTDLALGGQTITYAVLLSRDATSRSDQLWIVALGAAGMAAVAGSLHHAVFPEAAPAARQASWRVVGLTTGLAGAAMLAAGVYATITPRRRPWWLAATAGKAVVFGALNLAHNDFRLIIYDYATSMLLVLALMLVHRRQRPGAWSIVAGIVVSFLAAAIQMSNVALHKHFNHNDLYHLVQAIAFHLLYRGAASEQSAGDRSAPVDAPPTTNPASDV